MPKFDGIYGTKMIKAYDASIKVLILTTFKDDDYIRQALNEGADGYLLKSQPADSIIDSIKSVYHGSVVFEDGVMGAIKSMRVSEETDDLNDYNLSERELDVLKLVGRGMSNKEIGESLFLGEGTRKQRGRAPALVRVPHVPHLFKG